LSESDNENGPSAAFEHWIQIIDGAPYGCWYRLRDDGQIEVWARGHHVVLPIEALALLPEAVARAVIKKLVEGKTEAVVEAYTPSTIDDPPGEQLFINLDEPQGQSG
jgi:hypothetical protein